MEQKSEVHFRAEKLYKNSKEKFGYLIRETVSNSIHSALIKQSKDAGNSFIPQTEIEILFEEKNAKIIVKDNGEGFNELNRKYFTHLDSQNSEKQELNLKPLGQGRLALVFFTDQAHYSSIYKNKNDYIKHEFDYPDNKRTLFDIENITGSVASQDKTETILTMEFSKQQTYKRLSTFVSKYDNIEKLKNWFIENFFPFFVNDEKLSLIIKYNGDRIVINKNYIEKKLLNIQFDVNFEEGVAEVYTFKLWLIEKEDTPRSKNFIKCFARQLQAELESGKLEYEIDLSKSYDWFLTSEYFDNNVDQKGDKIEIQLSDIQKIENKMVAALNDFFKKEIISNREQTEKNIKKVRDKYHSISVFIDEKNSLETNRVLDEKDILDHAIENKGKTEKRYWINEEVENEDSEKLLNSSLNIYVNHRNRVLKKLHELIKKYDQDGDSKSELEDEVHDLFLKRGETLSNAEKINHLHNLWILDDKYTIFSSTSKGLSTKKGQELSDIYLWIDDPDKVKELLILELKSTTKAHNAGDKYESMIAQVKRYATQFYKEPERVINWDVDTKQILYSGVILARKSDIYKELNSNSIAGVPNKIPFLESSYYFNEKFSIGFNNTKSPEYQDIRIEIYSYEDIYELALNRNTVFFKLLNGEYDINGDDAKNTGAV